MIIAGKVTARGKAGPSWQRLEGLDVSPNLVTRSEPELSFNG